MVSRQVNERADLVKSQEFLVFFSAIGTCSRCVACPGVLAVSVRAWGHRCPKASLCPAPSLLLTPPVHNDLTSFAFPLIIQKDSQSSTHPPLVLFAFIPLGCCLN